MSDGAGPEGAQPSGAMRAKLVLGAAAVVVATIALFVSLNNDDSEVSTTIPSSTTSEPIDTTTTEPESTTTTTTTVAVPDPIYDTAVWPWADTAQRFSDPVAAARSFAADYVGFTDPLMGEFLQGDSRSGEVEVKPRDNGPVTTVFVRQLGADNSWFVLGSATANIEVTEPTALSAIASPVTLAGRANAFEGNVNVTIRVDGKADPIAEGFVTGMMGEMGPFESAQEFPAPGGQPGQLGSIVFRTLSAEDGSVWEAGVVRVRFAAK